MPRQTKTNLDDFIGMKLRQLRHKKHLSQNDLAEMLNVTHQQIQKYESGINRFSVSSLYAVANIFKVDMKYFLKGYKEEEAIN